MGQDNILPVTAIVLTYNEEINIRACLESISGWVSEIFVVDSGSTDKTLPIAREFTENIVSHPFETYSIQRNWAIVSLPITQPWVLNLDADNRVTTELQSELKEEFSHSAISSVHGFLISRRTMFMGKWIRHGGHYPVYHAMLFRKECGRCEDRLYDQHFVVSGIVKTLKNDAIDVICDSITKFVDRHNRWASLEAEQQLKTQENPKSQIKADFFGNKIERRRYLRALYYKTPIPLRSFLYIFYRYFVRLGFLDGPEGLIFHFLQGFWYRFLVDAKIYEIRKSEKREHDIRRP